MYCLVSFDIFLFSLFLLLFCCHYDVNHYDVDVYGEQLKSIVPNIYILERDAIFKDDNINCIKLYFLYNILKAEEIDTKQVLVCVIL